MRKKSIEYPSRKGYFLLRIFSFTFKCASLLFFTMALYVLMVSYVDYSLVGKKDGVFTTKGSETPTYRLGEWISQVPSQFSSKKVSFPDILLQGGEIFWEAFVWKVSCVADELSGLLVEEVGNYTKDSSFSLSSISKMHHSSSSNRQFFTVASFSRRITFLGYAGFSKGAILKLKDGKKGNRLLFSGKGWFVDLATGKKVKIEGTDRVAPYGNSASFFSGINRVMEKVEINKKRCEHGFISRSKALSLLSLQPVLPWLRFVYSSKRGNAFVGSLYPGSGGFILFLLNFHKGGKVYQSVCEEKIAFSGVRSSDSDIDKIGKILDLSFFGKKKGR